MTEYAIDQFTLPGDIPDDSDDLAAIASGGTIPDAGDPCWQDGTWRERIGARPPEPSARTSHPAGRGWIPTSRDIGLPRDEFRAFSRAGVDGFAVLGAGVGQAVQPPAVLRNRQAQPERILQDCERPVRPEPVSLRDSFASEGRAPNLTSPTTPHNSFSPERQTLFCEHLSLSGNVRAACAAVGVSPQTVYRVRRKSPVFAQAWDAALVLAHCHAEAVLADRALAGIEEDVWYRGEIVGTRRRYDSRLLLAHIGRLDARLAAMKEDAAAARRVEDFDGTLAGVLADDERLTDPAVRERWMDDASERAEREVLAACEARRAPAPVEDGSDEGWDDGFDEGCGDGLDDDWGEEECECCSVDRVIEARSAAAREAGQAWNEREQAALEAMWALLEREGMSVDWFAEEEDAGGAAEGGEIGGEADCEVSGANPGGGASGARPVPSTPSGQGRSSPAHA